MYPSREGQLCHFASSSSTLFLPLASSSSSNLPTHSSAASELESITKNPTHDSISPFLSSISVTDSSDKSLVRKQCVAATCSIAAHVTKPPFTLVVKPFVDALVTEQDLNSQIGSALCLATAMDGAPDPEPVYLRRMITKIEKLLKCDSFKAKAALLTFLGSVIDVGAASSPVAVKNLVNVLVEFVVKNEDWSVR